MKFSVKLSPYEIDKIKLVRAKNNKTESLESVKARTGADVIINGGTFNMTTGKPESYVTIDGKNLANGYCGWGYGVSGNVLDWSYQNALNLNDFFGAYGLLVTVGEIDINLKENKGDRQRTAIGYTANDELVIYCTTDGVDYKPLAEKMLEMGCITAINLDGGGSTQWYSPKSYFSSGRAVSWWICIYLTSEGKKLFESKNEAHSDIYKTKNADGLVKHCKRALAEQWGYVWGTYGKVLTKEYLDRKADQYDDVAEQYNWIYQNWLNRRCADCVGLIKSYMWWNGEKDEVGYISSEDKSAVGMFNAATVKGTISTMPDVPGLCVYIDGEHIGVYIGNGEVIEARGTKYGVVKTKLKERPWTHWLACPYIEYPPIEIESKENYFNMPKAFINGTSRSTVYQDTLKITRATTETSGVGTLGAGSKCVCLGTVDGFAIVIYKVTSTGAKKVGLVEANRGRIE